MRSCSSFRRRSKPHDVVAQMAGVWSPALFPSERTQECYKVRLLLRCQSQPKPCFIEVNDVQQVSRRAVVEVGRTRREPAQDRSFDLADMIEVSIDQSLAKVGCCFASR